MDWEAIKQLEVLLTNCTFFPFVYSTVNSRESYCCNFTFKVEVFGLEGSIEEKYPHAPYIHPKKIKTSRGQTFLITGIQSHSMYLDFVLKKLDWGESIPERKAEL